MKKNFLLITILILKFLPANSQILDSMLKVYAEEVPDQKIHVHLDKDVYRAGETVWFKGYLFSGFGLSYNSKNFYAELVNEKGDVVQRKVFPVAESSAAGHFDLPENSNPGNLLFRAYTTWMLNFDTAFLFEKQLSILDKNGIAASNSNIVSEPSTTSIHFFPEGGDLVSTLASVVAFKANDNHGKPVFVKGNIVNSKGKVVTSFAAKHDGLGTFSITPEPDESYNAVWSDSTGRQQTTALPVAKKQGLVLHMSSVGKKKVFTLNRTADAPESLKAVYIIAQLAQEKIYKARVSFQNILFTSGAISTESLPSGILQVTVFSETWEPLAERIVMVNNNNYLLNATVDAQGINTNIRAKNTIEVEVGDTLLSNLSVSVTDALLAHNKNADNIISRLLLTGDLKGYIHNPGYYFSNHSDSVANHLDLVLLTHGWRRYNWSALVHGRKPVLKFPNDAALSLNARVFGVSNSTPLRQDESIVAIIQAADSSTQILSIPKTGADRFSLTNAFFFDTIKVFYDFSKDRRLKDRASVLFENNFYKGARRIDMLARPWYLQNTDTVIFNRTRFLADQLKKFGSSWDPKGNVLQNVTVRTKVKTRTEQLEERYTSGMFRNADGYNFDFTANNNSGAMDIFTFLQGRVPGLQISRGGMNASVTWRGSQTSLFVDEMPSDASRVLSLSVNDIAYVKVIRPPFMGAFGGGAGGAVAIYTRRGGDTQVPVGQGLNSTIVTGYASSKQFYSPNYATRSASGEVVADYRSTLFWDPAVLTGPERQKVRLEFYNNDISKSFRVVLEGVNEIGKMIRIEKVIQQ